MLVEGSSSCWLWCCLLCQQSGPCSGDGAVQEGGMLLRGFLFSVGLQDRDRPWKGRAIWDHPQPLNSSRYLMFLWWKEWGVGVLEVRGGCVAGHQWAPYPFVPDSPYYVWMQKLIYWVFFALAVWFSVSLIPATCFCSLSGFLSLSVQKKGQKEENGRVWELNHDCKPNGSTFWGGNFRTRGGTVSGDFKKAVESYLLGIFGWNFRTVRKKHEK